MSDVLLEVAVPVWEQDKCADSFTQTIFSTVQCAAGMDGGKDSCQVSYYDEVTLRHCTNTLQSTMHSRWD